jgi:hypothetical protein
MCSRIRSRALSGAIHAALASLLGLWLPHTATAQVRLTVPEPLQVDTQLSVGGWECAVAVDKCNPDNVVGVWMNGMARSADGGSTWSKLHYTGGGWDPTIAYHPRGSYAWNTAIPGPGLVHVIRRVDPSVDPPGGVSDPHVFVGEHGKDRTGTASGPPPPGTPGPIRIYMSCGYFADVNPGVWFWWANSVESWEDTDWVGPVIAAPGCTIHDYAVGRGGTLYMIAMYDGGTNPLKFAINSWDGTGWHVHDTGAPNVLKDFRYVIQNDADFQIFQYPSLDVDASLWRPEKAYVAYMALAEAGSDDVDIFLKRGFPDGGDGWDWSEPPILVSDDTYRGCAQVDQFWPYITVDERGYLHIIYYEACAGQCTAEGGVVEIFPVYCFSDDGGATFRRYELGGTSPAPWAVDCSEGHIGDYIGIDSGKEQVYPLYTGGSQNGRIYTNQIRAEAFDLADFNADCMVGLGDFSTFADCFGLPLWRGCYLTDLDGDCDVDLGDFATFAVHYGAACPPGWPDAGERSQSNDPIDLGVNGLAEWTVQNIPAGQRQEFAQRCVETAEQSDDDVTAARLLDFAEAIVP